MLCVSKGHYPQAPPDSSDYSTLHFDRIHGLKFHKQVKLFVFYLVFHTYLVSLRIMCSCSHKRHFHLFLSWTLLHSLYVICLSYSPSVDGHISWLYAMAIVSSDATIKRRRMSFWHWFLFPSMDSPDHIVTQEIFGRIIKSFTDSHEVPVVSRSLRCLRAVAFTLYLVKTRTTLFENFHFQSMK